MHKLVSIKNDIIAEIDLPSSKSISNRLLIIRALCKETFRIDNLSTARDSVVLEKSLLELPEIIDVGHAGTAFRFMTAYLSFLGENHILTGSVRMKERPIGVLVEVLRELGAQISYLENEGYPPLKIGPSKRSLVSKVSISSSTSSQYISALLLIAPSLPNGLDISLLGETVSRPYIDMTISLMEEYGIRIEQNGNRILIEPQEYKGKNTIVESDWSAASYFYMIAAFSRTAKIRMNGLKGNSIQADYMISEIMKNCAVHTEFGKDGIVITKNSKSLPDSFEYSFISCPDIAQTVITTCAGLNIGGIFSGLKTLRIKETDRIQALKNELIKINMHLAILPEKFSDGHEKFILKGQLEFKDEEIIFDTYDDHRMAMAFATLAVINPVSIKDPFVVVKSFPNYWKELEKVGILIE